jgi:hypothetical protein
MRKAVLAVATFGFVTIGAPIARAADFVTPVQGHLAIVLDGSSAAFHNTLSIVQPDDPVYGFAGGVDATHPRVKIRLAGVTALNGCSLETVGGVPYYQGLPGVPLVSEKESNFGTTDVFTQHGCRVQIVPESFDPSVSGSIDYFPAGTVIRFAMCSQVNATPNCEYIWVSDHTKSTAYNTTSATYVPYDEGLDHLHTTPSTADPTHSFMLSWEDVPICPRTGVVGVDTTTNCSATGCTSPTTGGYASGCPCNCSDEDFNDIIAQVRLDGDTDGDGLWDDWEKNGISDPVTGVLQLNLPALGASYTAKDVFVHIDYMDCSIAGSDAASCATAHSHVPDPAAISKITTAYTNQGITLHIETSPVAHAQYVNLTGQCNYNMPLDPGVTDFDTIKAVWSAANPAKHFAYHYGLIGHLIKQTGVGTGATGCAEAPGNDFLVTLASLADGPVGSIQEQAGTIMHELGHNFDLHHGGGPNCTPLPDCVLGMNTLDHKPNYLSVMNYMYQLTGIPCASCGTAGSPAGRVDYSTTALAVLDETTLDETVGVGGSGSDYLRYFCPAVGDTPLSCPGADPASIGAEVNWPGVAINGAIDWSCDMASQKAVCSTSIDNQVTRSKLSGYNDWGNLDYSFQTTGDFEDGIHVSPAQEASAAQLLPPAVSTGGPYACECGNTIVLDGTGSTDPNGTIASYGWSFNTPTVIDQIGSKPLYACTNVGADNIWLTVTDNDGLAVIASDVVKVTDTTPPVLHLPANISATADAQCGGANVSYTATAVDLCSGPVPISCSMASGARFGLGTTTVQCSATDPHGNTATGSFTVTVRYSWSGFLQPINADGSSIFKFGSTIPTKFQLTGASAGCAAAVVQLEIAPVSNNIVGTYVEDTSNVGPDSGANFRYDASGAQYIFNAGTKGLATGTWQWRVDFLDGDLTHTVNISLK